MNLLRGESALIPASGFKKITLTVSLLLVVVSGLVVYKTLAATEVTGLSATYYNNPDFTGKSVSRVDKQVSFNWGAAAPVAGIDAGTYSARWTGTLTAPATGTYRIGLASDDGVRLWIGNEEIVNSWTTHSSMDNSGSIALTAGQKYDLKIEFFQQDTNASLSLYWWVPGSNERIVIPTNYLNTKVSPTMPTPTPTATPAPTHTPTPTPKPTTAPGTSACTSFPDATCTGVPKGTVLAAVSGDINVTTAGTVIDAKDVSGVINISASNVTIKRSRVRGRPNWSGGNGAFINVKSGTNILIEDVEITSDNPSVWLDGIWGSNVTINRVNVHGGVDGMKLSSNSKVTNSYVHDMNWFASDPNQSGGADSTHNDAIQILDGTGITISGNTLATAGNDPNSAIQITQDFGLVSTVAITGNKVDYGGCTLNFAQKGGGSLVIGPVTGNRFGRHQGFPNCTILIGTKTSINQNSGNVWDDTGAAIPAPQQHD